MLNRWLDLLFPAKLCALCQQPGNFSTQNPWCSDCQQRLNALQNKYGCCQHCGRFLLTSQQLYPECSGLAERLSVRCQSQQLCPECREYSFPFMARAAYPYEAESKKAIHALKFRRDQRLATAMAKRMYMITQKEAGFFALCEVIVPVPLSPNRLQQRGFNQSQRLAKKLGQLLHLPCAERALFITRSVSVQHTLSRQQRQFNLLAAMQVKPKNIKNRHVLLVDDIMTTGSTLTACSQTLLQGGARSITCLCWSAGIHKPSRTL